MVAWLLRCSELSAAPPDEMLDLSQRMICQHLFILPISSTGYTMAVESSPAGPTALVPLGDPD